MFERFTAQARQVIVLAQEEARIFKHNYMGTEHLLLGLIRENEGLAAQTLSSIGLTTVERARVQVIRLVGQGNEVTPNQLPFTPRLRKVLEQSIQEADALNDHQMATHHLLLGLLRENEGVANRVLLDVGGDAREHLHGLVLARLEAAPPEDPAAAETVTRISRGTRPVASVSKAGQTVGVCSFCGQKGSHMFAGFPAEADEASICDVCLDVFHAHLSRHREEGGQKGPASETG